MNFVRVFPVEYKIGNVDNKGLIREEQEIGSKEIPCSIPHTCFLLKLFYSSLRKPLFPTLYNYGRTLVKEYI